MKNKDKFIKDIEKNMENLFDEVEKIELLIFSLTEKELRKEAKSMQTVVKRLEKIKKTLDLGDK